MVFLERRQTQNPDASTTEAASPEGQLGAIIGATAAGSVVVILVAIFLGYWLRRRRARKQSEPSPALIDVSLPKLEVPGKARRRSLILSLGTLPSCSSPVLPEKPLPSPPTAASLLSSAAFTVTPMTATFPAWAAPERYSEKSPGYLTEGGLLVIPNVPPPTRTKLSLVRMISVKRLDPIDVEKVQAVTVEQAVDSGLRLVEPAVVLPPYTPR
ncbi:hypothetical protein OH76DRAFT_1483374 [Lentinus brumalis]|uniref:Uncharacterized protein n=1 Tax=Lentinus brumalis TaxID=2498619 RepID=A0A371D9D7_9APHY|nr:hypothetical protein OH76DRAFT_1483374 [Polyporus brumalis]